MFPFFGMPCWGTEPMNQRSYQERKLRFMRWVRDDLETRLAAVNASIETLERQLGNEETTV